MGSKFIQTDLNSLAKTSTSEKKKECPNIIVRRIEETKGASNDTIHNNNDDDNDFNDPFQYSMKERKLADESTSPEILDKCVSNTCEFLTPVSRKFRTCEVHDNNGDDDDLAQDSVTLSSNERECNSNDSSIDYACKQKRSDGVRAKLSLSTLKIQIPKRQPVLRERSVSFGSTSVLGGPAVQSETPSSVEETLPFRNGISNGVDLFGSGSDSSFIDEEKAQHLAINDALHLQDLARVEYVLRESGGVIPNCSIYTPVLVTACTMCTGETIEFALLAIKRILKFTSECSSNNSHIQNITINASDPDTGFTALHWSAALGCSDVMEFLLAAGASPDVQCLKGETPLHRASRFGKYESILLLLQRFKAHPMKRNNFGESPVDVAASMLSFKSEKSKIAEKAKIMSCFFQNSASCRTLVLHHDDCLQHQTGADHQEAVERIPSIIERLSNEKIFDSMELQIVNKFPIASFADISRAHSQEYAEFVLDLAKTFEGQTPRTKQRPKAFTPRVQASVERLDESKLKPDDICDTSFSEGSLNAALRAAGSIIFAIRKLVKDEARNAFCAVRPPGHHAGWNGHVQGSSSCGFCIFNSVAIGALYALEKYKTVVKRVAIVDFDVHHGNGTEEILKVINRPDELFFASTHLYGDGFYPGSGENDFIEHNIMNLPITPLWKCHETNSSEIPDFFGRNSFRLQVAQRLLPALRCFRPDLIIVSAGYDGCKVSLLYYFVTRSSDQTFVIIEE